MFDRDMQLPRVAPTFSHTLYYFEKRCLKNGNNEMVVQEQLFLQVRPAPLLQLLSSDDAMA